ncbi:hypothetical protein FTX61_18340 [Nitriliruptoraceae bacterium ZYF776]|nr:hypothetical protein [Profundirhabdus halotolerans]
MTDSRLLDTLAQKLWDERHVVTVLLYKLTVTRLLLAADDRRFLPDALREVEQCVDALRHGEAARDEALRALAGAWHRDPSELTLVELAREAPEPYAHTFGEHLAAFRDLAGEIERVSRENRALARTDLVELTDQLDLLTGTPATPAPATYDARGRLDATSPVGGRLREVL